MKNQTQNSDVASHNGQANVSASSKLPLDDYVELISKRFPKYISIEETRCNVIPHKNSVLFRKRHHNEYCHLQYFENSQSYSISLFKCDWEKDFEKMEDEYLNSVAFAVTLEDLKVIMNCVV